jgi:hypothetical protein
MRKIVSSNNLLEDTSQRVGIDAGDYAAVTEGKESMDNDLKQYLEGMEARMFARFATKDDLERTFAEMRATFATKEDLERVETALLTEFHKWASPAEMRAKSHAQAIRLMDTEMESLAERVDKLEGKQPS